MSIKKAHLFKVGLACVELSQRLLLVGRLIVLVVALLRVLAGLVRHGVRLAGFIALLWIRLILLCHFSITP